MSDREKTTARATLRAAWCGAAVALYLAAGCTGSENVVSSGGAPRQQSASFEISDVPAGVDHDPLAGLPVIDSRATLVVTTFDGDGAQQLQLLELATGSTTDVPGVGTTGTTGALAELGGITYSAMTPQGELIYTAGPRSLGVLDLSSRAHTQFDVPDTLSGELRGLGVADGAALVRVGPRDDPGGGTTAVLDLDGTLRCTAPSGTRFNDQSSTVVWADDLRTRMDPRTCEITDGLHVPETTYGSPFVEVGGSAFVDVDETQLGRFDLNSGDLVATSPTLDSYVSDAIAVGEELWATTDAALVRLDQDSLQEVSRTRLPDELVNCGSPYFVTIDDGVYLVDDCSGLLLKLDPSTGAAVHGWRVPDDRGSDRNLLATPTDEGIWFVDVEQTGEPYFFDLHDQRFERLALDRDAVSSIYAHDLHVHPGPTD